MPIDLAQLHKTARRAFDRLQWMAETNEGSTADFHERQFVFELGVALRRRIPWLAFEFSYPTDAGGYGTTRCDLVGWKGGDDERYIWIETKCTGFARSGRWRNAFGSLGWSRDLEKLRKIPSDAWDATHHRKAFVWLYQFENYRRQVAEHFGESQTWRPAVAPQSLAPAFERKSSHVTLATVLTKIGAASPHALASVKPRVGASQLTALIVTATP